MHFQLFSWQSFKNNQHTQTSILCAGVFCPAVQPRDQPRHRGQVPARPQGQEGGDHLRARRHSRSVLLDFFVSLYTYVLVSIFIVYHCLFLRPTPSSSLSPIIYQSRVLLIYLSVYFSPFLFISLSRLLEFRYFLNGFHIVQVLPLPRLSVTLPTNRLRDKNSDSILR